MSQERVLEAVAYLLDTSLRSRLGSTSSLGDSWRSDSSLRCILAAGVPDVLSVVISVGTLGATLTTVLTYDSPVLSSASQSNIPGTGSISVSLLGSNYGQSDCSSSGSFRMNIGSVTSMR